MEAKTLAFVMAVLMFALLMWLSSTRFPQGPAKTAHANAVLETANGNLADQTSQPSPGQKEAN